MECYGSSRFSSSKSDSSNGRPRGKRRRTTPVRRTETFAFRITHPFHPQSGREFEAVARKEHGGEQRVCFIDQKGRQCEIPLSWTDLAAEDPVRLEFVVRPPLGARPSP